MKEIDIKECINSINILFNNYAYYVNNTQKRDFSKEENMQVESFIEEKF